MLDLPKQYLFIMTIFKSRFDLSFLNSVEKIHSYVAIKKH